MNLSTRIWKIGLSFFLILSVVSVGPCAQAPEATAQFNPDHWSKEDLSRYLALENGFDPDLRKIVEPQRSATSSRAMIAGTSDPLAVHAGLEVALLTSPTQFLFRRSTRRGLRCFLMEQQGQWPKSDSWPLLPCRWQWPR